MAVQLVGIDALENLLVARAGEPAQFAPVPASVENSVLTMVNSAIAVATAVLSIPANPAVATPPTA